MARNYYIILGIKPDATEEQIKSAYRRKAKELHPDYYGEDREPFQSVQEAYSVLSDPARRKAHDNDLNRERRIRVTQQRMPAYRRHPKVEPLIPEERPVEVEDLSLSRSFLSYRPSFEELFDRLGSNFSGLARPKAEMPENLTVEILLSAEQARQGGSVRIMIPAQLPCPTCRGRGWVGPFECLRCNGTGVIRDEYPIDISYPPGISTSYITQIPLDQFGIHNFYLTAYFRVSRID
jgi:molecular chaperone DnaJ